MDENEEELSKEFDIDHILYLLRKLDDVNKRIAKNEEQMAKIQGDIDFWQLVVDEFYDVIEEENEQNFD